MLLPVVDVTLREGASLRHDAVTDRWVVMAPHRRETPFDAEHGVRVTGDRSTCPFCPGHEDRTTPTLSLRTGPDGRWRARAFDNLYPSLFREAAVPPTHHAGRARPATGSHEVLVETADHDVDLAEIADDHAFDVMDLYRERLRAAATVKGTRAALLFKNRGPRAGASLIHAHAQVVALPITPPGMRRRDALARQSFRAHGQGTVARCRDLEIASGARGIEQTPHFVVYCPFASHRKLETWIVPLARTSSLARCGDTELAELGGLLTRTLRRVRTVTRGADYNVVVRTPALRWLDEPWAQWHIEILPRLGGDAGFEIASEMYSTSALPEESAALLRSAV